MSRPRVLVVWEFGRNLGHLSRLRATAKLLEAEGCKVVWAVPEQVAAGKLDILNGYEVFIAPRIRPRAMATSMQIHSFADILLSFGFGDADALASSLSQWCDLLRQVEPVSVVLDYAPTAQLAAQIADLPAFQLTNGFDAPPPHCPVFGITARGPLLDRLNQSKLSILDSALDSLAKKWNFPDLADRLRFFNYSTKVFDCINETDPYGPRDAGIFVGPLSGAADAVSVVWPRSQRDKGEDRIFAYMRGAGSAVNVVKALRDSHSTCICVWPDAPREWLIGHSEGQGGLLIQTRPVKINEALSQAHAVVSYGPTTTVCQTALAGVPQLIVAEDFEKRMACARLVDAGAAIAIGGRGAVHSPQDAIDLVLSNSLLREGAAKVAARYSPASFAESQRKFARLAAEGRKP